MNGQLKRTKKKWKPSSSRPNSDIAIMGCVHAHIHHWMCNTQAFPLHLTFYGCING